MRCGDITQEWELKPVLNSLVGALTSLSNWAPGFCPSGKVYDGARLGQQWASEPRNECLLTLCTLGTSPAITGMEVGSGDRLALHQDPRMPYSQQRETSWAGCSAAFLTWSWGPGAQTFLASLDTWMPGPSSMFHLDAQGLLTGNLRLWPQWKKRISMSLLSSTRQEKQR